MYPDTTTGARRSRTRALARHTCQPGLARGDESKKILGKKKEEEGSPGGRKIKRATGYACETSSLSWVHPMICTEPARSSSVRSSVGSFSTRRTREIYLVPLETGESVHKEVTVAQKPHGARRH